MGDFNTIYKILAALKASMDYEIFDLKLISAERLGVSEPRLIALLMMLVQAGYITGLSFDEAFVDVDAVSVPRTPTHDWWFDGLDGLCIGTDGRQKENRKSVEC